MSSSKRRTTNSRTRYQRLMPTPFCVFAARRIHKSPNLDGCDWYYISDFSKHCCYSWRNLFATKNANFDQSYIDTFLSAVEEMSGGTDNTVSISGSNGSADQLTNWDGTKKLGLAAPEKKKGGGYSHLHLVNGLINSIAKQETPTSEVIWCGAMLLNYLVESYQVSGKSP